MKKLVSIFLIIAMIAATLLAVIPASADEPEVVNLLPAGVLNQLKNELAASNAGLHAFAPYAPYVYTNSAVNNKIAGSKLLSINIPVNKTGSADANGNFYFTLGVLPSNKAHATASVNDLTKYRIAIKGSEYGLNANSNVFKFIKVDLSAYNIYVREDETLTFFDNSDTIFPVWASTTNSELYVTIRDDAPNFMGFAACAGNIGGSYNASPTACIIFDLELEKNIDIPDAPEAEPIVPADQIDFTNYETRTFMSEDVYNGLKSIYENKEVTTTDWALSVSPFTPINSDFVARFAGTRLRTISLPVNKTLDLDGSGNLTFTIHTWKSDKLTSADGKVNSWTIKIKPADYGLSANASFYKFITVDISSYNIVIAKDEVLSFGKNGDTLILAYNGVASYLQSNCPEMMGFGAYTGDSRFTSNSWPTSTIFFNFTYDVPVSTSYLELRELYDEVSTYQKNDFTSGWTEFKKAFDAVTAKMANASASSDYSDELEALETAVAALVLNTATTKAALTEAISSAAAYADKQNDYTEKTWTVLTEALANANTVSGKSNARQSEIDLAAEALLAAIDGLVLKNIASTLTAKINALKSEYDRNVYTAISYQQLINAINRAESAMALDGVTNKKYVEIVKDLDDAVAGLEARADFTEINKLVAQYENVSDKQYDPFYFPPLELAIRNIKQAQEPAYIKNVSQAEANKLLFALEAAIDNLREYADYVQIDIKLSEIARLKKSEYTEESWAALEDVLLDISDLQANPYAYNDEAQALLAELNAAVEGLVKSDNPVVNEDEPNEDEEKTEEETKQTEESTVPSDTTDNTDAAQSSGCASAIGATAVMMSVTLALGGFTLLKKKEN